MQTIAARSEADAPDVDPPVEITDAMRAAAAAFGRMGGKLGGPARAASLSKKRRSEIAKGAVMPGPRAHHRHRSRCHAVGGDATLGSIGFAVPAAISRPLMNTGGHYIAMA
jgi:hypothetical protein